MRSIELTKSFNYVTHNALENDLDFVAALYPESIFIYEKTREHISGLESAIRENYKKCSFQIICETDYENSIKNMMSDLFSEVGIILSREASEYICTVNISENLSVLPAGFFYKPFVSVVIEKNGEVIFAMEDQISKIGAKNEHIARQRAFSAILTCIKKMLKVEFWSYDQ